MTSDEQNERPVDKTPRPASLVQFFRESPLVGLELDLERDKSGDRDVEL